MLLPFVKKRLKLEDWNRRKTEWHFSRIIDSAVLDFNHDRIPSSLQKCISPYVKEIIAQF